MELVEYFIIAVAAIAAAFALVNIVRRTSAYYRQRYNISIWSGVFMAVIAGAAILYALIHYQTPNVAMLSVGGFLLLLTGFLDIRHAGFGMGVAALLLQIILAAAFAAVIVIAVVLFIARLVRRGNGFVLNAAAGGTSVLESGVEMFFRFFMP